MLTKTPITDKLMHEVAYAINSMSRPLIYRAIGMVEMARRLDAITHDDYIYFDRMLIRDTLNNPEKMHKLHLV